MASFAALTVTGLPPEHGRQRRWWRWGGAATFGLGIWAMHFTGMLALHSPAALHYDLGLTLASLLLAVGASALALTLALRPTLPLGGAVLGGAVMGAGIAGMHYTGMAAMRGNMLVSYSVGGVVLSVAVAVLASVLALVLAFALRGPSQDAGNRQEAGQSGRGRSAESLWRGLAALVLGLAISSMHYTGMWAARFAPARPGPAAGTVQAGTVQAGTAQAGTLQAGAAHLMTDQGLALGVGLAALLLSGLFVLALFLERRFAEQAREAQARQDQMLRGLQERETLYQTVVDTLHEGVILLDGAGTIRAANASARRLLRRRTDELLDVPLSDFAAEMFDGRGQLLDPDRRPSALARRRQPSSGQVLGWRVEGQLRWFLSSVQPMEQGLSVYSFMEITQERAAHDQLAYRANHDELTGLLNRHRFKQALTEAMYASFWQRDRVAVLFLDLDQFKDVNDTLGHLAGDRLLRAVTERLRGLLPPEASAARFGGDEFAVCLGGVQDRAEALAFAGRVCAALAQPFTLQEAQVHIGASIGLCLYPDDAHDEDLLLQYADMALYAAKANGRGGVAAFEDTMALGRQHRVRMGEALRGALERGELSLVYQPVLALQGGELRSCEALLRWEHPEWGAVSPAEFVPLAEEIGLIDRLGLWVLEQACAQARLWADAGTPLKVAVNISPLQFRAGTLPQAVADILERTGLAPSGLELEVTESTLIGDRPSVQRQLGLLRGRGVTVALDDFGTGYSSLSLLQQLQVDRVKLDRSFVRDLGSGERQVPVIGALVQLAAHLGLEVVAEGIETAPQRDLLRDLACPLGQGYLLGRPAPAGAMMALLRPPA